MAGLSDKIALLALSNGNVFLGKSKGFDKNSFIVGEVVFNTAITGYQEIITDPSYQGQIINFTHPHIGNTGINSFDRESIQPFVKGIIARKISTHSYSWRTEDHFLDFLEQHQIVAIDEIDTRAITRSIRDNGSLGGCIAIVNEKNTVWECTQKAIAKAKELPSLAGVNLAQSASKLLQFSKDWREGAWDSQNNQYSNNETNNKIHIVVLDCGCKRNILRSLTSRGCLVTVMPYNSSLEALLTQKPDGVLLSNGPGDPFPCTEAIDLTKSLIAKKIPLFGLCLGHQIIALALGGKTEKMKFGHHGANHPVKTANGRVLITSQNHNFSVCVQSLPTQTQITHTSLFDNSLQGIKINEPPVMTFQGHPEASPGPHDGEELFDDFILMVHENAKTKRY